MALPTPLTGKQRRHLRSLAHHMDAVVQVGWQGVTEPVQKQLATALHDHELVKVKLAQGVEDRAEVAAALAEGTRSECVQLIGRVCLFYRPRPKDPKIVLPGEKAPAAAAPTDAKKVAKKKTTKRAT